MRIKPRQNFGIVQQRILSQNSNRLKLEASTLVTINDDHCNDLNIVEQIKRGVRLHPVEKDSKSELSRSSSEQFRRSPSGQNGESLSDILARVLKKRNSVMQQTDDESELSSIDSQPDQYDVFEEFSNDEDDEGLASSSSVLHTESSEYSFGQTGIYASGRVDLIIRL